MFVVGVAIVNGYEQEKDVKMEVGDTVAVGGYAFRFNGVREENGERVGFNTMVYSESEIRRIGHVAFQAAQKRNRKLCSVDKMNVLECTQLWRDVMIEIAHDYPDVALSHMLVDNAAMQLVRNPKQFDVVVTGNIFGDILSDEASMLAGSIGGSGGNGAAAVAVLSITVASAGAAADGLGADAQALAVFRGGVQALAEYVDDLMAGDAEDPLRLFQPYADVLALMDRHQIDHIPVLDAAQAARRQWQRSTMRKPNCCMTSSTTLNSIATMYSPNTARA